MSYMYSALCSMLPFLLRENPITVSFDKPIEDDYEIIELTSIGTPSIHPHISLHIPTKRDIGIKILNAVVLDVPWFILKNFYFHPAHSTMIMYLLCPNFAQYAHPIISRLR